MLLLIYIFIRLSTFFIPRFLFLLYVVSCSIEVADSILKSFSCECELHVMRLLSSVHAIDW